MGKSQLINTYTWSSSQIANTVLATNKPEAAISPGTGYALFLEKLKGFNLVRGTAVYRYVLNAEPFHAGKLIASFIPVTGQLISYGHRQCCLNQKSQQPNVEIDCRDATAIIKIPYIAPTDYYETTTGDIGWGTLTTSVLSPLVTGTGSNSITFSLFLHFEDFEMAAPMIPQSGVGGVKMRPRSRPSKGMSVSDRESDMLGKGTISKALLLGSQALESAASVPMLTAFAAPASWVARGAAHLASWFGWSKPMIGAPQDVVTRRFIPNMANSSGATSAPKLALLHDNQVDVLPYAAGNGLDEMSFAHLKRIKAYCNRFSMSSTQAAGELLYSKFTFSLATSEIVSRSGLTGNYSGLSFPPFAYVSRFFKYWRGSIKMHIKIAKTDYHSGRIMVVFTPKVGAINPVTLGDSTYALREVIDIRNKSEFILELPYLINTPYLSRAEYSGRVDILVLNSLQAPSTVADSIEFLVYFSAGDDYEVQVPCATVEPSDKGTGPGVVMPWLPQSGVEPELDQDLVDNVIGNYSVPIETLAPARMCMGECFTSVKQLLNKYTTVLFDSSVFTSSKGGVTMYPFALGCLYQPLGQNAYQQNFSCDAFSNFACGYAFYRGSTSIEIAQDINTNPSLYGFAYTQNFEDNMVVRPNLGFIGAEEDANTSVFGTGTKGSMSAYQHFDASPFLEASVPYQTRTHMTTIDYSTNGFGDCPTSYSSPNTQLTIGWPGASAYPVTIHRSMGDEFQLCYFLGFPPILTAVSA